MKKTLAWFVENPVAANLLMMVIMTAGLISVFGVTQEVFPESSADIITISVPYLGAAPEEVEEGVTIKIEEQIQSLEGIKRLTSTAAEGLGTVMVEVEPRYDVRRLLDDIKSRVDAIVTFPEETERPVIQEVVLRRQVISVAVSGQAEEGVLRSLAERVRDEISAIAGITQVQLANARPYEISIEVSEQALLRHGLTFDQVAAAVRASSLDLPGGSVRSRGGEILLRSQGQAYDREQFERLPLITRLDGTVIEVGDVAEVFDGFAETDQSAGFDGRPAILVQVFRVGRQSAIDIADKVKDYVKQSSPRLPEGIQLTTWQDDSKVLRSRLDLLLRNGWAGLLLVVLILALFLRVRLALWVSLGIPISFLGTLWLMPSLDLTINLMSLFAFIVVLGILVDDAIVVGEGIHSAQQAGLPGIEAAKKGAEQVAVPVIFGVLTTVAAFFPLTAVEGAIGKIMRVIPLVVIPCLTFSLIESLLILPAHLSHFDPQREARPPRGPARLWAAFQGLFANGLIRFSRGVYAPLLEVCLRWRYLSVATAGTILLVTIGWVVGGRISFVFLPEVEAENVAAFLTMPLGTPAEVTAEAVARLEESALEAGRELILSRSDSISSSGLEAAMRFADETPSADGLAGPDRIFRHILSSVGEQPFRTAQSRNGGGRGEVFSAANLGEVNIELAPSEQRAFSSTEVANLWRDKTGLIADAVELTFSSSLFSPGEPVNVELSSSDLAGLQRAAEEVKKKLTEYPGVFDIADSYREGKQEIELSLKPSAQALGLTLRDLARQVRQAFYGEEAQRIQRGRDEVKVMVRYPESARRSLGELERMFIRTPSGAEIPFSEVADVALGRGFSTIQRVDRRRAVNVTANVDQARTMPNDIIADLRDEFLPELQQRYPGLLFRFEGRQREQAETLQGLGRGYLVAMIAIFALLAVPLRSYAQPLIVMSAIPFGLVGAVLGHIIMGIDLTILSGFGIVALAGVVVNDSLVMVHQINRRAQEAGGIAQAVREAGVHRFRPIILTSLTTFGGLTPLLLEKSLQAQFLIPMAVSLAFGVVVSTAVTLLIVPSLYLILEDVKAMLRVSGSIEAQPSNIT